MHSPRDGFPHDKPASLALDLERRSELEKLVARMSLSFVGLAPDEVDEAITAALTEIGTFVGADRSYVFLHDLEQGTTSNTHEWCADGITPEKDNLQDIPLEAFPYILDRLENEFFLDIPVVTEMPPEAAASKEALLAQGIRSLALVAMRSSRGRAIGFVGFDAVRQQRPWFSTDYHLLRLTADLISATLESHDLWRRLIANEARNRALIDALPDTMVIFNAEGQILEIKTPQINPYPEISKALEVSHIPDFLGPDQAGIFIDTVARVEQGENPALAEFELLLGGESLSFEVRVTRYREGEYLALVREITQRKKYEVNLRALALQLSTVEEDQRRKLAQLLHDGIGQELSALHYQMQSCLGGPSPAPSHIEKMIELLRGTLRKTQDLTFDLSPPLLYELGLGPALQALVRKFDQDHAGSYSLLISGPGPEPDSGTAVIMYRVARELLVNAAKHSEGDKVSVHLENGTRNLVLTVSDNGRGLDFSAAAPSRGRWPGGFGLYSIQQQLEPLGGQLELTSEAGTRATITLPRTLTTGES